METGTGNESRGELLSSTAGLDEQLADEQYQGEDIPETEPEYVIEGKDERKRIAPKIDGEFVQYLYFNPANPFIYEYLDGLTNLPDMKVKKGDNGMSMMRDFNAYLDRNFDGIFGPGSARTVFSYGGSQQTIMKDLVAIVRKILDEFNAESEKETAETKKAIMDRAKAQSQAYFASTAG